MTHQFFSSHIRRFSGLTAKISGLTALAVILLSAQVLTASFARAEDAKAEMATPAPAAEKKTEEKAPEKTEKKDSAKKDTPAKTDEKKDAKAEKKAVTAASPKAAELKSDKIKATAAPAVKGKTADGKEAVKPAVTKTANATEGAALPAKDVDESKLIDYPPNAIVGIGKFQTYVTSEEDTFLDIARHYDLGYVELRAANPTVDPWSPTPGTEMLIPTFSLLPRAPQDGIVVNLGKMRLYHFRTPGQPPESYAIGIGREGLSTPLGETTVVRKVAGPQWYPTARMRKEKPYLPAAVAAGPANPLGTHALYLGWPTFLIHGSNKPWGIGRRVSSGCMRMYPEDIITVFNEISPGTRVTVVDQPILVGWHEGSLYLEANPSQSQSNDIDFDNDMKIRPLTEGMKKEIIRTAGEAAKDIDWQQVETIVKLRRGYPIAIAGAKAKEAIEAMKKDTSAEPPKSGSKSVTVPVAREPEARSRQRQWQE